MWFEDIRSETWNSYHYIHSVFHFLAYLTVYFQTRTLIVSVNDGKLFVLVMHGYHGSSKLAAVCVKSSPHCRLYVCRLQ